MKIDYSPLRPPDLLGAVMDPIAATAAKIADDMQARKRQERELAFRREQEQRLSTRDEQRYNAQMQRQASLDAQEKARLDLQERRNIAEREVANAKARQDAERRIRRDAVSDPASAELAAKSHVEVDPRTGEVRRGIAFEKLPGMEQPEPPMFEQVPETVMGPQISEEDAARSARARSAMTDSGGPGDVDQAIADAQAGRQEFERANDPMTAIAARKRNEAAQKTYQDSSTAFEADQANPKYRIGDTVASRDELRYSKSGQDAEDFDNYAGGAMRPGDADGAAYAKMLGNQIRAGGMTLQQGSAALNDYIKTGRKMAFDAGQGDLNRQSRERVASATAARPRPSSHAADASVELRRRAAFEKQARDMAARYNIPQNIKASLEMAESLKSATSDNSVLQSAAQFGIAKEISGGGGQSLSNKDVEAMSARAGGFERLKGMVDRFLSGQRLSDGEKKVLADAIRERMGAVTQRINDFGRDYDATFLSPDLPYVRELGEGYVRGARNQFIPGSGARPQESGAQSPANRGDNIRISEGPLPGAADAAGATLIEDPDSEDPLPEDPQAQSIDDYQVGVAPAPGGQVMPIRRKKAKQGGGREAEIQRGIDLLRQRRAQ